MDFREIIRHHKSELAETWFQAVLETYPAETAKFIGSGKDNFTNPVGATLSQGLHGLLDGIIHGEKQSKIKEHLDKILRIRAIQSFSPSQAVGFIFPLRKILKNAIQSDKSTNLSASDAAIIEDTVDRLLSSAFDVYMACREELFTLRANREKNIAQRALKKLGYLKSGENRTGEEKDT